MHVPCLADVNALEDSVLYLQQRYADCSRNSYGWKNVGEYMLLSGRGPNNLYKNFSRMSPEFDTKRFLLFSVWINEHGIEQ